jgi:hypothetical protein
MCVLTVFVVANNPVLHQQMQQQRLQHLQQQQQQRQAMMAQQVAFSNMNSMPIGLPVGTPMNQAQARAAQFAALGGRMPMSMPPGLHQAQMAQQQGGQPINVSHPA